MTRTRTFRLIAFLCILAVAIWVLTALFAPELGYHLHERAFFELDSEEFLRTMEAAADAGSNRNTRIEVLSNGEEFYPAMLAAIQQAQRSVTLEAYIFEKGEVAQQFIGAMAERARNGVKVRVVVDAVGSLYTEKEYFRPLTDAGGHVEYYHPLRWYTLPGYNNRTHREILVVDGRVGFVGGAGIADHWLNSAEGEPRWRDSMFRLHGDAVSMLQGTFMENWVEVSGEILVGADYFHFEAPDGGVPALVVTSSPSSGRSTRARMLYQTLIGAATRTIDIATPYFIPDDSATEELVRAIRERGVRIRILVPGTQTDHHTVRSTSRAMWGPLLEAGAEMHEYQPSMIHTKAIVIDDLWSVVGSTNMDNRSFGLNDEVNLAARDPELARRLTADFERDLQQSRRISYSEWQNRPWWERALGSVGWIFERQQ